MTQITKNLKEQRTIADRLLKVHLRYCEECQDSVQEDRRANCSVGVSYVVRIAQIDRALEETEKVEIEGGSIHEVVFTENSVILRGEYA